MKLTLREQRVVIAGSAVALAILIFYAITSLLPDRDALLREVDQKKSMLLKQREILSLEDSYKKKAGQSDAHLAQILTRLLPGDNSSVAGAELQKVLKDFADQSGVEITQRTTLPDKKVQDSDLLTKISVRIETNCDLEQLVNFLTAIENYDKFLKVEELIINSYQFQKRFEIRPSLIVIGYISSPAARPAGKAAAGTGQSRLPLSAARNPAEL